MQAQVALGTELWLQRAVVNRDILTKVVTEGGVEKRVPVATVGADLAGKIIVEVGLLEVKLMKDKGPSKSVKRVLDLRLAQARPDSGGME